MEKKLKELLCLSKQHLLESNRLLIYLHTVNAAFKKENEEAKKWLEDIKADLKSWSKRDG